MDEERLQQTLDVVEGVTAARQAWGGGRDVGGDTRTHVGDKPWDPCPQPHWLMSPRCCPWGCGAPPPPAPSAPPRAVGPLVQRPPRSYDPQIGPPAPQGFSGPPTQPTPQI